MTSPRRMPRHAGRDAPSSLSDYRVLTCGVLVLTWGRVPTVLNDHQQSTGDGRCCRARALSTMSAGRGLRIAPALRRPSSFVPAKGKAIRKRRGRMPRQWPGGRSFCKQRFMNHDCQPKSGPAAESEARDYRRRFVPAFRAALTGCCASAISCPLRPSSLGWMLSSIHFWSHHSTGSTATPSR